MRLYEVDQNLNEWVPLALSLAGHGALAGGALYNYFKDKNSQPQQGQNVQKLAPGQQSLPAVSIPSTAGAGRGGQGGPTAAELAAYNASKTKQMSPAKDVIAPNKSSFSGVRPDLQYNQNTTKTTPSNQPTIANTPNKSAASVNQTSPITALAPASTAPQPNSKAGVVNLNQPEKYGLDQQAKQTNIDFRQAQLDRIQQQADATGDSTIKTTVDTGTTDKGTSVDLPNVASSTTAPSVQPAETPPPVIPVSQPDTPVSQTDTPDVAPTVPPTPVSVPQSSRVLAPPIDVDNEPEPPPTDESFDELARIKQLATFRH